MGCLSLKALGILVGLVAVFVKVVNPLLNTLIPYVVGTEENRSSHDKLQKIVPYDPNRSTDILEYPNMGFVKKGHEIELHLGLTFILMQSFPKWFIILLHKYEKYANENEFPSKDDYENRDIDILDARHHGGNTSFQETGFTLLDMSEFDDSNVSSWRSQQDIKVFQDVLEVKIRQELFPEASRIEFTYSVVRGGTEFGDQPAAINAPHLDYSQNDTARRAFHRMHPPMEYQYSKEQHILLGIDPREDNDEELLVLLGIWKPILMSNPVCDHPMAVMDARTFHREQEVPHPIHINFGIVTVHNLNGGIMYHEDQKWYYYSFQTPQEVLVFTQYTRGQQDDDDSYFCTPHGSFENPNCPEGYDSRVSIEMRAAVFVKKQQA